MINGDSLASICTTSQSKQETQCEQSFRIDRRTILNTVYFGWVLKFQYLALNSNNPSEKKSRCRGTMFWGLIRRASNSVSFDWEVVLVKLMVENSIKHFKLEEIPLKLANFNLKYLNARVSQVNEWITWYRTEDHSEIDLPLSGFEGSGKFGWVEPEIQVCRFLIFLDSLPNLTKFCNDGRRSRLVGLTSRLDTLVK